MIYTPENVIGATLPCGAKVVEAEYTGGGRIYLIVSFDRAPKGWSDRKYWWFTTSGKQVNEKLPDLIPPAPHPPMQQQQFWREVFLRQMGLGRGCAEDWAWHADESVRVAIERGML